MFLSEFCGSLIETLCAWRMGALDKGPWSTMLVLGTMLICAIPIGSRGCFPSRQVVLGFSGIIS